MPRVEMERRAVELAWPGELAMILDGIYCFELNRVDSLRSRSGQQQNKISRTKQEINT